MEDEKKALLQTVTLNAEELREMAANPDEKELLIFGEGDGALSKDGGGYRKPKSWPVVLAALLGTVFGMLLALGLVSYVTGGLSKLTLIRDMGKYDSSVISELLQRIDAYHFGETPSSEELLEKASHALVDGMNDPYASYFSKREYESYTSTFNGNYYGVGVVVQNPDGTGALIKRVYEGSFAEQAGLLKGDLIIGVDGEDVRSVSGSELVERITGEEGTTVDITVIREGAEQTVTVTRGEIYVKRVDSFVLDGGIGYIYLTSFSGSATEEFKAALELFKAKGVKKLIVDLRDDPGGSLWTVIDICDMLLPDCVICSMQGKTTEKTQYYRSDKDMYDFELAVLVNGYSASASEIFAGAMQDNGRGTIVGTQTYGKGVVQTTFTLDGDHGFLKLTTDAYYTPNGTNLGGTGITPDIEIDLPEELKALEIYELYTEHLAEDVQLAAAIEALK